MKQASTATKTVLGLDVGTSRIVIANQKEGNYGFSSQLNAFVNVPWSKMTENAFKRENLPFTVQGDRILIQGNEAPRFAEIMQSETKRPMVQGFLNPAEPESVEVLKGIVDNLVKETGAAKPMIYFSVPATPLGASAESRTYHETTVSQVLGELGYESQAINEGLAVIFSELEDTNYTGVGVSFGGGLCNVAFAYLSMPGASFSIAKAGDFIDTSAAAVTGELAVRVRAEKEEKFHFNGSFTDRMHQVLTVYYDDMIESVIAGMKQVFSDTKKMPKVTKPVPVVISGGTASPEGFRERFEKALLAAELPIPISEVRLAKDPLTATARGALIAGLAEA
jgi:actin-like ATPase involved in cell morphogenesis